MPNILSQSQPERISLEGLASRLAEPLRHIASTATCSTKATLVFPKGARGIVEFANVAGVSNGIWLTLWRTARSEKEKS